MRRTIENGEASAQASADDLAAAHLSIQTTLAQDYLQLRITDQQRQLYMDTVKAYTTALKLTQAQHAAGVALLSDVALAQSQLTTAQAAGVDLDATRATLEHAIAILTGRAPSQFSLAEATAAQPFNVQVPVTPAGLPSDLLQRRPDIAGAERRAAAANANIGVARAAYFPSLTLSANGSQGSTRLGDLFNASSFAWSLGLSLAETIFDGGARTARVDEARANWKEAVANYRQTVLGAFQGVEDQLSNAGSLEQQQQQLRIASKDADQTEQIMQNQYQQGLVAYTDVVTAQASALTARRALLQISLSRQTAAIQMISELGGGWTTQQLAAGEPAASAPVAN